MRKMQTDSAAVELRFLVAPGLVEAARLAMAPYCLEEHHHATGTTVSPGQERRCAALTVGELKILLQD